MYKNLLLIVFIGFCHGQSNFNKLILQNGVM